MPHQQQTRIAAMNCPVATAELNNDLSQSELEREATAIALEQMTLVEDAAKRILSGHTIIDMRTSRIFNMLSGVHETKRSAVPFSMRSVADLVQEKITPALCLGLHRGEPQALFLAQKIVGDAAHEIAFDALNLWSSPFLDYDELKETAEQV